jgi:hypothetical protein
MRVFCLVYIIFSLKNYSTSTTPHPSGPTLQCSYIYKDTEHDGNVTLFYPSLMYVKFHSRNPRQDNTQYGTFPLGNSNVMK